MYNDLADVNTRISQHIQAIKMKLLRKIIDAFDLHNDACFEEHKNKDGKCYGLVGGNKSTDYLSEHCISCKHHTLFIKD